MNMPAAQQEILRGLPQWIGPRKMGGITIRQRALLVAEEEQVDRERPDVILLDLMMPVMDGVAFSQALRKRPDGNDVPIVVISADGNPQRATAVGAVGYLAKPFDIDALLSHVAAITRGGHGEPGAGV